MASMDPPDSTAVSDGRLVRIRRSRLRWIGSALILAVMLLVIFLPSLAGSPLGRPILLTYVNRQLNGRAEIRDCSFGWFHGMTIDGLVVFDATGRQVLQASRVTSGLRFLDLLEGRFRFRAVHADDMDVLISRGEDGSTNWEHLVRADSTWRNAQPRTLASGELFVTHGSSTYEDQTGQPPVFLRSMTAYVNLSSAGGTFVAKLGARASIGTQTSGQVLWDGSTHPGSNGSTEMFEELITKGLDPTIVSRRLGPSWSLVGKSDGQATFETGRRSDAPATSESQPRDLPVD